MPDSFIPAKSSQPLGETSARDRNSFSATLWVNLGWSALQTPGEGGTGLCQATLGHIPHMDSSPSSRWGLTPHPVPQLTHLGCLGMCWSLPLQQVGFAVPSLSRGHGTAGICSLGCPVDQEVITEFPELEEPSPAQTPQ